MPSQTGDKSKGRFWVENLDRSFIIPYNQFKIEEETSRLVDRLKIKTGRNDDLKIGDELAVYDSKDNDRKVFGGYITSRDETDGLWDLEVDEYVKETVDKKVKRVYRDVAPEDILQDLIDNETSLQFFAPVSSDFVISKYLIEGKIETAIKDMTDLLDWQARTEPNREFYFEPRGRIDSNQTFTHASNAVVTSKKTKDSKFINTVELRAGRTNYERSNNFSGDGSTVEFELTEVPTGSVRVSVDGTDQEGAIAEDLQSGDDFYIDTETPALIFASAPSSGANIDIDYTYEVPILVEAEAPEAQIDPAEREISETIKRKWLKNFEDAREYAKNYVENHSQLIGDVKLYSNYDNDIPVGYLGEIIDNNKSIDDKFVIERKTIHHTGQMDLKAGSQEFNAIEWRNQVQRKLKELEQEKTTNKVLTKYFSLDNNLDIDIQTSISIKQREINDTFIIGHPVNGTVASEGKRKVLDNFEA